MKITKKQKIPKYDIISILKNKSQKEKTKEFYKFLRYKWSKCRVFPPIASHIIFAKEIEMDKEQFKNTFFKAVWEIDPIIKEDINQTIDFLWDWDIKSLQNYKKVTTELDKSKHKNNKEALPWLPVFTVIVLLVAVFLTFKKYGE